MYDRSYCVIVYITRPFHRCIARFWQAFDITPSLVNSIASIYILCFTQIAATSLKLLHFTKWQSLQNETNSGSAFFYNAEMGYFDGIHILYGLVALLMLIFIILLPSIFLTLYQFKVFLKVLEFMKIRKYLIIGILVDTFTSEFQNGTFGKKDYRYFAGLYLLLRVFIMFFYYMPYYQCDTLLLLQAGTTCVVAGVIMIFRPYKKLRYTLLDFLLFMILTSISFLNYFFKIEPVVLSIVVLMYLPICGSLVYFSYWFCTKVIYCCKRRCTVSNKAFVVPNIQESSREYDDNEIADRLLHPDAYVCRVSKIANSTTLEGENISSFPLITPIDTSTSSTEPTHSTVGLNETVPEYGSIN